jgi:ribosome maturation factor RimP
MADKAEIKALIEQHIAGTDQFLVDIKLSPNRLAVFIDKPEGVKLDECSSLCRFLLNTFETTGFLESHEVEVGSPGMDTPLVVPQQYFRRIGREMKVVNQEGKEMTGVLVSADENGIELKETITRKELKKKITSEEMHKLTYADIREAKLIINFKFNK